MTPIPNHLSTHLSLFYYSSFDEWGRCGEEDDGWKRIKKEEHTTEAVWKTKEEIYKNRPGEKDMFKRKFEPFDHKIWLASPTMHGEELKYITEAYETNWMSTVGKNINEVERIAAEKAEVQCILQWHHEN